MRSDTFDPDQYRQDLLNGGFGRDLRDRQKTANKQRKLAEEERESKADKKGSKPTFLRPDDIAGGYDFKRALVTSLGMPEGQIRLLTKHDLLAFKERIEELGKMYQGGITVEQVISLSRQEDIDRANSQIFSATAVRRKSGIVHFVTNASQNQGKNAVKYHHVNVEFLAFNELAMQPKKVSLYAIKNKLALGKVKFECDCGRFNFWYRYLNTVGGTVLGRKEGGFPKIRNPEMSGVACKHILRVMHYIKSGHGQKYLATAVENERTRQVGARYKQEKATLDETISRQLAQSGHKHTQIKPKVQQEIKKLERKAQQRAKELTSKVTNNQTKAQKLQRYNQMLKNGLIDQAEFDLLASKLG